MSHFDLPKEGNASDSSSSPRIPKLSFAAVVLAAGSSSRLGAPKQLVRDGSETLLERSARVAAESGADSVIVVLGARAEQLQQLASLKKVIVTINQEWAEGMASSIRAGVQAALNLSRKPSGILLMSCDQPAVTPFHLQTLLARSVLSDGAVATVASLYAGIAGIPAVFPFGRIAELLSLRGEKGARSLLRDSSLPPLLVPLPGGEVDIDTTQDLEAWQRR